MRHVIIVAAAVLAGGCAMSEYTPDASGRGTWAITCPPMNTGVCFDKAKESCPAGYEVTRVRMAGNPVFPLDWDRIEVRCRA